MRVTIRETGEELVSTPLPISLNVPRVLVDGREMPVPEALGLLLTLRDYWKARALRFETDLADLRSAPEETL